MTHEDCVIAVNAARPFSNADTTGWSTRHTNAWAFPNSEERPIRDMILAAARYADRHRQRFESNIGDDVVLGPAWEGIVRNIRTLLNGECGRFDCGTLDGVLCDMLAREGFEDE